MTYLSERNHPKWVAKKIPLLMIEAEKEVEVDAKHAKIPISSHPILILALRIIAHEVMPLR
jgi:hypothetical protein